MPSPQQQDLSESLEQTIPHPHGTDMLSADTEYFRLDSAAKVLRCAASDLLHLGGVGKVEIIAPIVIPGVFKWPQNGSEIFFPEIIEPLRVSFNQADRVILSAIDLAKIEAVGWTIPQSFYAPATARRLVEEAMMFSSAATEQELIDGVTVFKSIPLHFGENRMKVREASFYSLWFPEGMDKFIRDADGELVDVSDYVEPKYSPEVVTTIDHLFLSKLELQRLIDGLPQNDMAIERSKEERQLANVENIGYSARHSFDREPMWRAAVYCLGKMVGPKLITDDLIAKIEQALYERFPDQEHEIKKRGRAHLTYALSGKLTNPK